MNKTILLIIVILINISIFAQNREQVINNKNYYYGIGNGKDKQEAEKDALNLLNQGISTTISSNVTFIATENSNGDKFKNETMFKSIVNSYSFIENLQNVKTLPPLQTKTGWEIIKFVEKIEVEKVFEKREKLIKSMVSEAQNAKKDLKIGLALKNYYWAYILLQTYPNGTNLAMENIPNIQTFLRNEIDNIFHDLDFIIKGQQQKDPKTIRYTMEITYKQNPVSELNYMVCLGTNCTNDITVKNGIGFLDIDNNNSLQGNIPLFVEYKYISEMTKSDHTIRLLFERDSLMINNLVRNTNFRKAGTSVYIEDKIPDFDPLKNSVKFQKPITENANSLNILKPINDTKSDNNQKYLDVLTKIENAIYNKNYNSIKSYFSDEGYKSFEKLIKYGQISILQKANYNFVDFQDVIMARSLQVAFSFNNKQFVENLVFDFDKKTNLINAVTFALNDVDVEKIIKTDYYPEESRKAIINFIETYQTAYAMKDTAYLNKVFSDDALIIVGRVLVPAKYVENKYIPAKTEQNRMTKKEFITHFSDIAKRNEYINLDLNDVTVKRSGVAECGETYGIQLKQNYFSSIYGDTGYLFLVTDLNDPKNPIIYVRTWQPERDYSVDKLTGLYDLTNIKTE